jgi:protein TonB
VSKIYDELKRAHQSKLSRDPVPLDLLASVIEKRSSILSHIDLDQTVIPLESDGEQPREAVDVRKTSSGALGEANTEPQLIADKARVDNERGPTSASFSTPVQSDTAKTEIQSASLNETSPPLQIDTQPEPYSEDFSGEDRIVLTAVDPASPQLVCWPQPPEVVEVHKTSFEAAATHVDTKTQLIAATAQVDNERGSTSASFSAPSDTARTKIQAATRSGKSLSLQTATQPCFENLGGEGGIALTAVNSLLPQIVRWSLLTLVLVLLFVGLVRLRPKKSQEQPLVASDAGGRSSLGLKSERSGSDWRVSWNQTAAPLEEAIGGHVSISDGAVQKEFDLGPSELRNGSLVYSPISDNVFLQLQLKYKNSQQSFSESVRIVAGSASQIPAPGAHPSGDGSDAGPSAPLPAASTAPSKVLPPKIVVARAESSEAKAEVNQLSRVESPLLSNSSRPSNLITPLKSEASNDRMPSTPPVIAPLTIEPIVAPEPKVPGVPSPSASLPTIPQAVTAHLEPAKLIRGESPVYPPLARRTAIRGSVELYFRISVTGEVHDAQVVSGSPVLARAALDAVKTWRYRPARRDGDFVDSEGNVTFQFQPD